MSALTGFFIGVVVGGTLGVVVLALVSINKLAEDRFDE
jgi:ABC-type nitrate/sulfonate/bicarbonate transport system permease component